MGIFDVFGEIIKQVANKNEKDENVKTADPVIFEEVKKKLENLDANVPKGGRRAGSFKDYQEKVLEAQRENEANPEVETADKSVFDDLLAELKKLQDQALGNQAVTNSGGSLELRVAPDMGANKLANRVPNASLLKIIKYSDNKIILDGQPSRFVLVDYQGQQGWILESYLTFT